MHPDDYLLPGEQLQPVLEAPALGAHPTDSEIDERYVHLEVRIVVEQARYPLKQIPEIVKSSDYNLQPDFQRRPRWSRERQSRLIESLIMNVPVPPIFLYETELSRYEVMDGRQRLTAINEYYANTFALEGLKEWPELNGRLYSQLPPQVSRGIDRRFLSAIVLLHETAKSAEQADRLKQLVFERINSGGEDLSPQEKRNALHPGPMNRLCVRLARHESLCRMWSIPPPTPDETIGGPNWMPPPELATNEAYQKMEDVELVLRFFAHRQRAILWRGGTRLEDYLTAYLKSANALPESVLQELETLFQKTAELAFAVLGESAFWLWRARGGNHVWVERPALIAYDPIMAAFSRLLDHDTILRRRAVEISDALPGFYKDNYGDFDGRKTNPSDIKRRDEIFFSFLASFTS